MWETESAGEGKVSPMDRHPLSSTAFRDVCACGMTGKYMCVCYRFLYDASSLTERGLLGQRDCKQTFNAHLNGYLRWKPTTPSRGLPEQPCDRHVHPFYGRPLQSSLPCARAGCAFHLGKG